MFGTGVFKVGYSRDRGEFLATFYPRGEVVVEGGVAGIAGGRESTVMVPLTTTMLEYWSLQEASSERRERICEGRPSERLPARMRVLPDKSGGRGRA